MAISVHETTGSDGNVVVNCPSCGNRGRRGSFAHFKGEHRNTQRVAWVRRHAKH